MRKHGRKTDDLEKEVEKRKNELIMAKILPGLVNGESRPRY